VSASQPRTVINLVVPNFRRLRQQSDKNDLPDKAAEVPTVITLIIINSETSPQQTSEESSHEWKAKTVRKQEAKKIILSSHRETNTTASDAPKQQQRASESEEIQRWKERNAEEEKSLCSSRVPQNEMGI
jgi:hypothetical protein